MAYSKYTTQNFEAGTALKADQLNHIEEGIIALEAALTDDTGTVNQKVRTEDVIFNPADTVEFLAGDNVTISGDKDAKTITISTPTKLSAAKNKTNNNVTIDLAGSTTTSSVKIKGSGTTTVTTDVDGVITVDSDLKKGSSFYNVLEYHEAKSVDEVVIKTKIPYDAAWMPVIHLKGYDYGNGAPIDLTIAFYTFKEIETDIRKFIRADAVSSGSWHPQIYLSTYTEDSKDYIAISIKHPTTTDTSKDYYYFLQFVVDCACMADTVTATAFANWVSEFRVHDRTAPAADSIIPQDNIKEVTYGNIANNLKGNASTASIASKLNNALSVKLNGGTPVTFDGSSAKEINITPSAIGAAASSHGTHVTADTVKSALGTTSGTSKYLREDGTWVVPPSEDALPNPNALTIGEKSYDGSTAVEITAADLGIDKALHFIGETTTDLTDEDTTAAVIISGVSKTPINGDVVLYGSKEFVWTGSVWKELGDGDSHALNTIAISAGDGLTGGGDLRASRTLSVGAGNGITVTADAVTAKAGNGITVDADGIKVNYGTTANTACEGNDTRLSDARTPVTHTHGNITNDGTLATASAVVVTDANKKILASASITTTELGYLNGVTSSIQTQLSGKASKPVTATANLDRPIILGGNSDNSSWDSNALYYANSIDSTTNKITANPGTGQLSAKSFNATSDARLKENFVEYTSDKSVLDLPIYKFDFIDGTKNQIGCKAQDLQEICPEIVNEGSDGYLSIQESKIVYLLLEEVKHLRARLDALEGR